MRNDYKRNHHVLPDMLKVVSDVTEGDLPIV